MICHEYKTIYSHIPKTGGTSVECMFGFVKYNPKYKSMREMGSGEKHWTIKKYQENYPEEFKTYYKWTIVRNPWEKDLSLYNMLKFRKPFEHLNFKSFLKEFLIPQLKQGSESPMIANQIDFLFIDGLNVMNKVVRFEKMKDQWIELCDKINKPQEPMIHLRNTPKKQIQEDYDQECIDIITQLRKKDIEYFNYKLPEALR